MKLHRIIEAEGKLELRVGIVPFLGDGRVLALRGGESTFAIGGHDRSDAKVTATKIAKDKLGLQENNVAAAPFLAWSGTITGEEAYQLEVYAVLVSREYEAANTMWMTPAEFSVKGRQSHSKIMNRVFGKIEEYLRK